MNARNLRWANAGHTTIDMIVDHPTLGEIPFSASAEDVEKFGRELFAKASAGDFGPIAAAPTVPIDVLMSRAENDIDAAASSARARFVSSGTGQDGTYVVKAQQAQAWAAAGYPADAVPPYVAAEAAAVGDTPRARADLIIATARQWSDVIGPRIEAERIGGKAAVRAAVDVAGVEAARAAALSALAGIGAG